MQFRKSKTSGPFRASLSKRGVGVSVGSGPLRYSLGADGKTRRTVRAPGTGVYATQVVDNGQQARPQPAKHFPWAKWVFALTVGLIVFLILI